MSVYLAAGLLGGVSIPFMISPKKYVILFNGLIKPHKEHQALKKMKYANGVLLNEFDYLLYLVNTFYSFGNMVYQLAYGDRYNFLMTRQTVGLILTAQFEYINETISNYDKIQENIKNINYTTPTSFELMDEIEKNYIREESQEEINLQNIALMKNNVKDEYEKYTLENSVITNQEYLKNLNPELRLADQKKNYQAALHYQLALDSFESTKRKDNIFSDLREVDPKVMPKEEVHFGKKKYIDYKSDNFKKLENQVNEMKEVFEDLKGK